MAFHEEFEVRGTASEFGVCALWRWVEGLGFRGLGFGGLGIMLEL